MCEYCNDENKGTQVYITETTKIELAEAVAELETKMYLADGPDEENEIVSSLFIEDILIMENRGIIHNCPKCGRNLDEEKN